MSQSGLEKFGAYQKARQLFDLVVADMQILKGASVSYRLIDQQMGSADSICANIEEGYGRIEPNRVCPLFGFRTRLCPGNARAVREVETLVGPGSNQPAGKTDRRNYRYSNQLD